MSEYSNPLGGLQNSFQHYILNDDTTFLREVTGPDEAYRQTRLGIYHSAYRLRLEAALAIDFKVLKAFVGDSRFHELALAYLKAHPSPFRNLRWFGDAMAGFLRNDLRFSAEPVLSELAEFEWALGLAFDATDAPQLSFEDLASVPPDDWACIRFIQHPSMHLITPRWNIVAIWHAQEDGETLPAAICGEQASVIAVWRKEYKSHFRTLDHDESLLWQALADGTEFGDACAELAVTTNLTEDEAPQRAAQLLRLWVDDGWIQSYEVAAAV